MNNISSIKWDKAKKDWCCKHKGRGCSGALASAGQAVSHTDTHVVVAAKVDCNSPPDNWEYAWTLEQKKKCHLKVYGCAFQVAHVLQWHDVKRHWCCANEGIGCQIGHHQRTMVARKYESALSARVLNRLGVAQSAAPIGAAVVALAAAVLVVARVKRSRRDATYTEVSPSIELN